MQDLTFRAAVGGDCADLALLADSATRRLTSHLWSGAAQPGQSAFEVGRSLIRNETSHFMHHRNWRVAELDGATVGALNGLVLSPPAADAPPSPAVTQGLNELKAVAAGTWYLVAAALHAEFQGRGLGGALLAEAEAQARAAGRQRLTLMVGSFNARARRLYDRHGLTEWQRRPFTAFPGSDTPGEWILMVKDLT